MRGTLLILTFLVIILFIIYPVSANPGSDLDLKEEPTYYCYKSDLSPEKYYYFINITLINNGDESSDETDIKLYEDDIQVLWPDDCKNIIFQPGEEKTFTFDWVTGLTVRTIDLRWMPSSLNVLNTDLNSGNETLQVVHESVQNTNNVPGMELIILIFAILFLLLLQKRKQI